MRKSSTDAYRKFQSGDDVSTTLSELTFRHIDERYKPLRFARELLASVAGVTPNTARNWLRRECAPQADSLGTMIQNDPEFREKFLVWVESLKNENKENVDS